MKSMFRCLLTATLLGLVFNAVAQESEREELAIAALEALMAAPPERALPLVEKVLASDHEDRVKKRALFVASQIDLPGAHELLLEFARAESSLQGEAIRMMGIGGDRESLAALNDIYRSASSDIRNRILEAFLIADLPDAVLRIAQHAESDAEFDSAVKKLAAMGAGEQLRQLGNQDGRQATRGLLHAYAVAGDLESLRAVALGRTDATPDLRRGAIQGIAIIGSDAARETLMQMYRDVDDPGLRETVMRALMVADHDAGLLELYRETTDPCEKRDLLRILVMMDSDAALDAIDAALEGEPQ